MENPSEKFNRQFADRFRNRELSDEELFAVLEELRMLCESIAADFINSL